MSLFCCCITLASISIDIATWSISKEAGGEEGSLKVILEDTQKDSREISMAQGNYKIYKDKTWKKESKVCMISKIHQNRHLNLRSYLYQYYQNTQETLHIYSYL